MKLPWKLLFFVWVGGHAGIVTYDTKARTVPMKKCFDNHFSFRKASLVHFIFPLSFIVSQLKVAEVGKQEASLRLLYGLSFLFKAFR